MKTPRPTPYRSQEAGFTLIELLLVITIIAILAALTVSGMSYAQQSAARNRTIASLSAIRSGLEAYKEKFGGYPTPANPTETHVFGGGKVLISGGASMLYQALSGDGSSSINLGSNTASTQPSDGKWDATELENKVVGDLPKTLVFHPANSAEYMLVDGFGRPFQYQKGDSTSGATVNTESYDLWSYGTSQESFIPSSIPDLTTKQKPALTGTWIKNW